MLQRTKIDFTEKTPESVKTTAMYQFGYFTRE
jgi:hypothetical protein